MPKSRAADFEQTPSNGMRPSVIRWNHDSSITFKAVSNRRLVFLIRCTHRAQGSRASDRRARSITRRDIDAHARRKSRARSSNRSAGVCGCRRTRANGSGVFCPRDHVTSASREHEAADSSSPLGLQHGLCQGAGPRSANHRNNDQGDNRHGPGRLGHR
jgi:hypothetical protein